MQRITPAQRALLISSFAAGIANPLTSREMKKIRVERPGVHLHPMWNEIDATEREMPARFKSGLGKKKPAKPFVNHQARYRKLKAK